MLRSLPKSNKHSWSSSPFLVGVHPSWGPVVGLPFPFFPQNSTCLYLSQTWISTFLSDYMIIASRKDRRIYILLNRTFRLHGLPQQNRGQGAEGRGYIPVPRQRDIGAPVPGTVKHVRGWGGGSRRSEGIRLTHAHGKGGGVTYRYRGISAPVPGTVKLVRGEVEEMKRSD